MNCITYVTLDHKTSHKGQFLDIEIYTSSESWINKLIDAFDEWFVKIGQYLTEIQLWKSGIWGCKKKQVNIEKIAFKFAQIKFLAMHITNQK